MPYTIAFANLKGGIGKTTICLNVAAHMAQHKDVGRVLVVDFDPQANATSALGIDRKTLNYSIYDALLHQFEGGHGVSITKVIVETSVTDLHLVPAELDLGSAIMVMHPASDRVSVLHQLLEPVRSFYDYILIDTPSDTGLFMLNSLRAADHVLVPLDLSVFALEALENLKLYCEDLGQMTDHRLEALTLVVNRCTPPSPTSKKASQATPANEVLAAVEALSHPVFTVPESVLVYRAQLAGLPILQHAPKSTINKAYAAIANHLITSHQSLSQNTAPAAG